MDPYAQNRELWDDWASFHLDTEMYRGFVAELRAGGNALLPLERRELGEIAGQRVLHLQCHVGTDTLSLARLGARAVGVDFSAVAIERARGLSADLGIEAEFVQAEIAALPKEFDAAFDLVFTSYGVLNWLRDLDEWAAAIERALSPGGRFYVVDGHPITFCVSDDCDATTGKLILEYPYLPCREPVRFPDFGSYASRETDAKRGETVEWPHGIAEILAAVTGAGMELEFLREHSEGYYPIVKGIEKCDDGHWRWPASMGEKFPLTFSLAARKPR